MHILRVELPGYIKGGFWIFLEFNISEGRGLILIEIHYVLRQIDQIKRCWPRSDQIKHSKTSEMWSGWERGRGGGGGRGTKTKFFEL